MTETNQSAYLEEQPRLQRTSEEIRKQLTRLNRVARYRGDDYTEQVLESVREETRHNLTRMSAEPYFGRLDFQEQKTAQPEALYIGKRGLENSQNGQLLVIDWRAPVAELYYAFNGGEEAIAYESPDGTVEGNVHLKRNMVIRDGELLRVVDSYSLGQEGESGGVADEFLLYRLGENKDNKLRDIVSTIQGEQDRIIRADRSKALFIQGVAGSGKTTVALHRLAYLLYRYRESMRAERMIIFAPNRMFLDYISGVLPELGVGHIQQTVFTDWALAKLDGVLLSDAAASYGHWFALGKGASDLKSPPPGRFKGSIAFMALLDVALDHMEASFLPELNFEPWEGTAMLTARQIRIWFYEELRHYPLMKRKERTEARIKRWLEMELDKTADPNIRKERKKKASARLKSYLKHWPVLSPLSFYTQLFDPSDSSEQLAASVKPNIPLHIAEQTYKQLKKKTVTNDDLAPLLYILDRWSGIESIDRFDHAVIDEAQDFSPFQLALLKNHVPSGSFTVLGDLSQGIHDYQGIHSWDEFFDLFEADKRDFYRLDRSYRSTTEIIEFANGVLTQGGMTDSLAVPVFRTGKPVQITALKTKAVRLPTLCKTVLRLREEGIAGTIAVITRTAQEAEEAHLALAASGMEANLIHAGRLRYDGGLSVVPAYLAKGLEFDAVVLTDVDDLHYRADTRDAKLLYVASTRALHRLEVLYCGTPSPLLGEALSINTSGEASIHQ
ncbi:MAG: AAA family ATPase [Gorillibacterium sp.]|nr:AAA family ATPase [Gorillibacterium sp.]